VFSRTLGAILAVTKYSRLYAASALGETRLDQTEHDKVRRSLVVIEYVVWTADGHSA